VALEERGVPYAPVYDSSEALEDRQAKFLGIEVEAQHPTMGRFRTVRFPVNFDGERMSEIQPPPTLGEHDDAIKKAPAGRFWPNRKTKRPDAAE
jgi:crotonobetainyl-CoA:carnitine CoA-transferase CaiB-like acyl-CoA transferase